MRIHYHQNNKTPQSNQIADTYNVACHSLPLLLINTWHLKSKKINGLESRVKPSCANCCVQVKYRIQLNRSNSSGLLSQHPKPSDLSWSYSLCLARSQSAAASFLSRQVGKSMTSCRFFVASHSCVKRLLNANLQSRLALRVGPPLVQNGDLKNIV